MPSFGSYEPIGFSTRPDTVFESVVPGDYQERQARRLFARRNAVVATSHRIPASPNATPIMPTPTGNLFLNTSLEEPATYHAPLGPPPDPREFEALTETANRERTAARHQQNMMRQLAQDQELARRCDELAEQLEKERSAVQSKLVVFRDSLAHWKASQPGESAGFLTHIRNSSIAASSNVRVWDIVSWFPNLPKRVSAALQTLQKQYHNEAYAQVALRRSEEKAGGWSNRKDVDQEILGTVDNDRVQRRKASGGNRSIFGLDVSRDDIALKGGRFAEPGQEREALLVLQAGLNIRKVLLEASKSSNYHDRIRPRYGQGIESIKFFDTLDNQLVHWSCNAIHILQDQIQPMLVGKQQIGLRKFSETILLDITAFSDSLDQIGLRQTVDGVYEKFMPAVDDLIEDMENVGSLGAESGKEYLKKYNEVVAMRDELIGYEQDHGKGILGDSWRVQAIGTVGMPAEPLHQ